MADVKEIYDSTVRLLPPKERLRLAALILSELTGPHAAPIDFEDSWSEEDVRDLTDYAVGEAATSCPEKEDLV